MRQERNYEANVVLYVQTKVYGYILYFIQIWRVFKL